MSGCHDNLPFLKNSRANSKTHGRNGCSGETCRWFKHAGLLQCGGCFGRSGLIGHDRGGAPWIDDHSSGAGCGVAGVVGRDVIDVVGRGGARVDDGLIDGCRADECVDAEIMVYVVSDGATKIAIGITDVDVRGVFPFMVMTGGSVSACDDAADGSRQLDGDSYGTIAG